MRIYLRFSLAYFITLLFVFVAPGAQNARGASTGGPVRNDTLKGQSSCGSPIEGHAHCFSSLLTGAALDRALDSLTPGERHQHPANAGPQGLGPPDLTDAYGLTSTVRNRGRGSLIAIVDAYSDPFAAADLDQYRLVYGLGACKLQTQCLRIVHQDGSPVAQIKPHPAGTKQQEIAAQSPALRPALQQFSRVYKGLRDWIRETALDLDMVSANCPRCTILLVEATDDKPMNLALAVDRAATYHPIAISNSYGIAETKELRDQLRPHYSHAGIVETASNGDYGVLDGALLPSAFDNVLGVGGTKLIPDTSHGNTRGWTERVWEKASSGCSAVVAKPSWQDDRGCPRRTVGDISYAAYNVSIYDSGSGGFVVLEGTSIGAPAIAAIVGLAGIPLKDAGYFYKHRQLLNRIVDGSNGFCEVPYICNANGKYSGPAGNGTPKGLDAFLGR